jgi:eukaryotic-like serine/threonine-protein kinase
VHSSIVQIHEVGCVDGIHYIAQEYVQGHNLREVLSREGPPELKVALKVMRSVAAALHRAAEKGIVHRDIKPENLFLTAAGGLKVLDFGIARLRGVGSGTVRGIVLGTPGFTAPEQARGEWDIVGARTDIWAVGATLFALLTGRLVHEEAQTAAHLLRVSMDPPPPVRQIDPDVPDAVARVIDRALSFSPQDRYGSAAEMRQAVAAAYRLTTGQNLAAERPSGPVLAGGYAPTLRVTTGTPVVTRRSKIHVRSASIDRWDAAAMATAFFALGGIVVGYFASGHSAAPAAAVEAALVAPAVSLAAAETVAASAPEPVAAPVAANDGRPAAEAMMEEARAKPSSRAEPLAGNVVAASAVAPNMGAPVATAGSPKTGDSLNAAVVPRPKGAAAVKAGDDQAISERTPAPDNQGPASSSAAGRLPPSALPGSAKRLPLPPSAGDHFDFVETRR